LLVLHNGSLGEGCAPGAGEQKYKEESKIYASLLSRGSQSISLVCYWWRKVIYTTLVAITNSMILGDKTARITSMMHNKYYTIFGKIYRNTPPQDGAW